MKHPSHTCRAHDLFCKNALFDHAPILWGKFVFCSESCKHDYIEAANEFWGEMGEDPHGKDWR